MAPSTTNVPHNTLVAAIITTSSCSVPRTNATARSFAAPPVAQCPFTTLVTALDTSTAVKSPASVSLVGRTAYCGDVRRHVPRRSRITQKDVGRGTL